MRTATLLLALLPLVGACLDGRVPPRDIALNSSGCEPPTEDLARAGQLMLPGSLCQGCHTQGGAAGSLPWTLSGTVFNSLDAPCNTGGVDGAQVDIIDANDNVVLTLTTNRSGNFFTAEQLDVPPVRAIITQGTLIREMQGLQPTTACATCHYPNGPAPGRIFLN